MHDYGQLGHGDDIRRNIFKEIKYVAKNVADVVCGENYTFEIN